MKASRPITIPFSKSKTFVWFIGAVTFVVLGCWLLFGNPIFRNALLDNPWFTKMAGMASFVFFSIAGYFFIRNLLSKGPGLLIDEAGIEDFHRQHLHPKFTGKI